MTTRWLTIAAAATSLVGCAAEEPGVDSVESAVDVSAFVLPQLTAAQRAPIVRKYDFLDPNDEVPRGLLEDTIVYFDANQAQIPQQQYVIVVDFSRYSGRDRFWLVDLTTGAVEHHKVAHGQGSDPSNDGYATLFSNVSGSYKSSLGFYLTGEIYDGTHPHSMRIDGLSVDGSPNAMADTNVRQRLVVVHEASYVSDSNTSQQGRSDGCFALDPNIERGVVDRVHDGTLMYAETKPLNAPVGRAVCGDGACDGTETADSCPADCNDPPADGEGGSGTASSPMGGGCATGSPAGLVLAFAALGVRRRLRGTLGG